MDRIDRVKSRPGIGKNTHFCHLNGGWWKKGYFLGPQSTSQSLLIAPKPYTYLRKNTNEIVALLVGDDTGTQKMLSKILKVLWAECSWRRKWSNRPWRGKETVSRSYLSRPDDSGHGRVEIPRRTNKKPGRASNTHYGHHLEGNHPCRPTAFERWYRKTDLKEIPRPEWFFQRSSRYAKILPILILF